MKQKFRFYVADSCIYGVTVYDRDTQQPAFGYGATTDMSDTEALFLAHKLNAFARAGKLLEATVMANE